MAELAECLGLGLSRTRLLTGRLIQLGKAKHAGFRYSKGIDGRPCRTPVYQIVGETCK
jgi:hypothetical protein